MKTFMTHKGIENFFRTNITSNWIYDEKNVLRQIEQWNKQLPWIRPYYAMKCNPSYDLLKTLTTRMKYNNIGLCVASLQEFLLAQKYTHNIIYTNPHMILYEKKHLFKLFNQNCFKVVDTMEELEQFIGRNVNVLIKMNSCNHNINSSLDTKFGCTSPEAYELIHYAKQHNINIRGVSVHIESKSNCKQSYIDAYKYVKQILEYLSLSCVYPEQPILDIGGGLLYNTNLEEVLGWTKYIHYEIIAETGRYYAEPSYHLLTEIIAKTRRGIFLDNGIYHELNVYHRDHWEFPKLAYYYDHEKDSLEKVMEYEDTRIFGPTCDSYDHMGICSFPKDYNMGDHIFLENMGAYTNAGSCNFNGILGASCVLFNKT